MSLPTDFYPAPAIGDVLFTRGGTPVSPPVAWFTQGRGEQPTLATHQGLFVSADDVLEATRYGILRVRWFSKLSALERAGTQWCIGTPEDPYTQAEKDIILRETERLEGQSYGFSELALQAADGLLEKMLPARVTRPIILFRRLGEILPGHMICSKAANLALIACGRLPAHMRFASPDDSWDFLMRTQAVRYLRSTRTVIPPGVLPGMVGPLPPNRYRVKAHSEAWWAAVEGRLNGYTWQP